MKGTATLRRVIRLLLASVLFLLLLFFIFRNSVLQWAINKVSAKIESESGATLAVRSASFSGFTGVSLMHISLVPSIGDTIFKADTVDVSMSFFPILVGTVRLSMLYASGVKVSVVCKDSVCNYTSFLHEQKSDTIVVEEKSPVKSEKNYALLLRRILDRAFNLAPQRASLNNIELSYHNDTLDRKIIISQFISDENSLSGTANDEAGAIWKCNGKFSQSNRKLELNVYPEKGHTMIPMTRELAGLATSFDTMHVLIDGYRWGNNVLTANGKFSVDGFIAYHKKVSDDTIRVPDASFDFIFRAGNNFFEIDSTSKASLSDIHLHPYLRYASDSSKQYSININTDRIPATRFFSSLPAGMFDEVSDIKADGTLQYALNFFIDSANPDSVQFSSTLKKEKFRIKNFGSANLLRMNEEFMHSVYEKGYLMRTFPIGPSNPMYTSLENISPNFVNAVLTSEDGNFFFHRGFNEDAFRKSITANFKAGKFVRGGSTITMQLIKNVYLTRKKTIARKAEEALLVWLIESNYYVSKERMLEVYMNIIELGPGVYGIGEASAFYFDKTPIQLSLPEGIFLASLLPRPKWFKYNFDTLGNLKPYLADYYRIVSDFMLKKSLISQEEHDLLLPNVVLKGPARELVIPTDTIPENDLEDRFKHLPNFGL